MEEQKRITSHDVARRAGVSRTTVSLVLNNKSEVSQISTKTVQRVMRAAQDLGYVPNAAAQALVSKRAGVLGLILSRNHHQITSDMFLTQVVDGLMQVAHQNNMRVLLDVVEDPGDQQSYQRLIHARQVDGILISGPREDDHALQTLMDIRFPTVLMGSLPGNNFYSVDVDNVLAARMATQHLIKLGHQRIACITNAKPSFTAAADRLKGYRMALVANQLQADDRLERFGDFDPQSGYRAMQGLLTVQPRPTAVFVASDVVAFGAISAILQAGLRIPQDIAVVGFDDLPLSAFYQPHLTSIHLPIVDLALTGGEILIQLINGKKPDQKNILLNTHLVIRESCGAHLPGAPG
jgi:LacI family transcriptional regulator